MGILPNMKNSVTEGPSDVTSGFMPRGIDSRALERDVYAHARGSVMHRS